MLNEFIMLMVIRRTWYKFERKWMVEVTNISKMWLCIVEEANMLLTGSYKPLSFCIMFFFYRKQFSFTISLPSFFIFFICPFFFIAWCSTWLFSWFCYFFIYSLINLSKYWLLPHVEYWSLRYFKVESVCFIMIIIEPQLIFFQIWLAISRLITRFPS